MNHKLIDLSLLERFKQLLDKKLAALNMKVDEKFREVNANMQYQIADLLYEKQSRASTSETFSIDANEHQAFIFASRIRGYGLKNSIILKKNELKFLEILELPSVRYSYTNYVIINSPNYDPDEEKISGTLFLQCDYETQTANAEFKVYGLK